MKDIDRDLTEDRLRAVFSKYIGILTDEQIVVDYRSVVNGS